LSRTENDRRRIESLTDRPSENHSFWINREIDSKVIDESDFQFEKHDEPRISTLLGIMID
jgi:hypothetical protein